MVYKYITKSFKGAGFFHSAGESKEGEVGFGTSEHPIFMKLCPKWTKWGLAEVLRSKISIFVQKGPDGPKRVPNGSKRSFLLIFSARDDLVKVS